MLGWIISFFVLALIAAVFGFTGIASGLIGIGQVLFYIFIILFVVSLIASLISGRSPKTP